MKSDFAGRLSSNRRQSEIEGEWNAPQFGHNAADDLSMGNYSASTHRLRCKWTLTLLAAVAGMMMTGGCSTQVRIGRSSTSEYHQRGIASYYADQYHGRKTASGERFNMHDMTAAHRTLPFGTAVRVRNIDNGKTAVVRINDRGPFISGRIIDLSLAAAKSVGMVHAGLAEVELYIEDRSTASAD